MNVKRTRKVVLTVLVVLAVYSSASAADPNLVAHWQFDEGEGTIAYDSVGDSDGTLVNGPVWTTGVLNGALDFDGVDDYVSIPDSNVFDFGIGDFSISTWFSTTDLGDQYIIDFKQSDNIPHIEIYSGGIGGFGTHIEPGNDRITTGDNVANGEWHHVGIALDNGATNGYKLYLDGIKKGERTASATLSDWDTIAIAARNDDGNLVAPFNGSIDDVRVYNRALSEGEIQELYSQDRGPIAHWKFDEGEGTIAYDSAGDNDATLVNGPNWTNGIMGGALSFDGSDDCVTIPNSGVFDFGTGSFSMSVWFKAEQEKNSFIVNFRQNDNDPHIEIYAYGYQPGSLGTHVLPEGDRIEGGSIALGRWHHGVVTMENGISGGYKLYFDGQLKGQRTFSSSLQSWDTITIGAQRSGGDRFFDGSIDDVRIYDRVLSADEIEELYQSASPVNYYYVDGVDGNDSNDGLSPETAFATIQKGIDTAEDGDTVLVYPAEYLEPDPWDPESINFLGKNIKVTSVEPGDWDIVESTVIRGIVLFDGSEGGNCVFTGFSVRDISNGAIYGNHTRATISHCVISGNGPCGATVVENCDGMISNCLITDNLTIYYCGVYPAVMGCHGMIKNCTIANNASGVGILDGGETTVENCIIYGNGDPNIFELQILVGSGGILNISYSDLEGGLPGIANDGTVNWGLGNIEADPCFVRLGSWDYEPWPWGLTEGDYHLKSEGWRLSEYGPWWVYDDVTSRGIDWGNPGCPLGEELMSIPRDPDNMYGVNVRINMGAYGGTTEASMAPHGWVLLSDLDNDGATTPVDLGRQVEDWLRFESGLPGDLNHDGLVNGKDYSILAAAWDLGEDMMPPSPDPMQWDMGLDANGFDGRPREVWLGPDPVWDYGATMRADPNTFDWSGFEFYFECTNDSRYSSGWISFPEGPPYTYTVRTGLKGQSLNFRVKARDLSPNHNETAWSTTLPALPGPLPPPDTTPPAPDPNLIGVEAISPNAITMEASAASDTSGVEYYFECVSGGGSDSSWQDQTDYTDASLVPETEYCYRVKARDKSPNQNETAWSEAVCVSTPPILPVTPPTPDPMQWDYTVIDVNGYLIDGTPHEIWLGPDPLWDYYATMRADPNTSDESGFEFYFQCTNKSALDSGWISFPEGPPYTYTVQTGLKGQTLEFRVKARDLSPNHNETAWSETLVMQLAP